jgi:hypothetical protein
MSGESEYVAIPPSFAVQVPVDKRIVVVGPAIILPDLVTQVPADRRAIVIEQEATL